MAKPLAKKASGIASVSHAEALEAALCYGWIDSQKKSYDETTYIQKLTRRVAHLTGQSPLAAIAFRDPGTNHH